MEEILRNMSNPAWWFTGLFFGVIIPFSIKKSPFLIKRIARNRLAKWKWKVKRISHSPSALTYEIGKTNSYFVGFLLVLFAYFAWYSIGSLGGLRQDNFIAFLVLILPIYIIELIWLVQNQLVVAAIKRSDKLRVTRRSN